MDTTDSFETENIYRSIFENAVEGIFQSTPQGKYLKVNPALARTYGYRSPAEMLEKLQDIGSQLYAEPTRRGKFMAEMARSGFVRDFQSEIYLANGTRIWIAENVRAVRDSTGRIRYYEGFVTDITELRRSQDELEQRDALLSIIFRTVPVGIGITFNRILHQVNVRLADMLGYTLDQMTDQSARILYASEAEFKRVGRAKDAQIKENGTGILETTWQKRDGTRMDILLSSTRIDHPRFKAGNIFAAIDITQRKAAEKESAQLQKQVQHFQKMESLGTLAGGIAHDINNLLTPILGYTELSLGRVPEGSPETNYLKQVIDACQRAKRLVAQILMFSRQSQTEKKPVRIKLVVKEALTLLRALIPNSVKMRENLVSDALVSADSSQIHQIVMNLCTNASYAVAGKDNGTIEVGLVQKFPQNPTGPEPAGHFVELYVRDNGHGIKAETKERIFEPFFTTKGKGEGSGLGLAVVHGIVRNHGGRIEVESRLDSPDRGTNFRIYLPILEAAATPDEVSKKPVPQGDECILFVDDEPAIADMMRHMLEGFGYTVVCRTSSTEALALFKAKPNQFNAMITDMIMPGMTGTQLAGEILRIRPGLPIILCSGCTEDLELQQARSAGIRHLVRKPVLMRELVDALRKVLDEAEQPPLNKGLDSSCFQ